jgi:hypothetical protein
LKALPENEPLDDSYPCPICQAAEEIADLIRITTTEQFDTALGIARLVVADEVRS